MLPILYHTLLLTAVHLLLRISGTFFQVFLSRRVGAAGVGLLQLTLSVGSLAMVAGTAGIRTAAMYLSAEELGRGRKENIRCVLSGCCCYCILFSCAAGLLLFTGAPLLAEHWIGDRSTTPALRLLAVNLPAACLCGVMSGYFTAAKRIRMLAGVEIAEQICSIGVSIAALVFWAGEDPGKVCLCVVMGSCCGNLLTLAILLRLYVKELSGPHTDIPISRRLAHTALPLAGADLLRSGIGTLENLIVPRRLALFSGVSNPLAVFGMMSGMVFPILMFPACILFALCELLIPELAGLRAAQKQEQIQALVKNTLRYTLLYAAFFCGLLFLGADLLCEKLYHNAQAGNMVRLYAGMVLFLYCDIVTDAMTKGLGQQTASVRYTIATNSLDTLFLYLLLPLYGMQGYFFSYLVTHLLNLFLSLRLLCRVAGIRIQLWLPCAVLSVCLVSIWVCIKLPLLLQVVTYPAVLIGWFLLLKLLNRRELMMFIKPLPHRKDSTALANVV